MKKIMTVAVLLAVALLAFGCTPKRDNPYDPRNGLYHNEITEFSFASPVSVATISGTTITATVPYGTDVTALVAAFTTTGRSVQVGSTSQVSGVTANNFSSAIIYRVTAINGTTRDYTVIVTVASNTAKEITAFQFTSALNSAAGVSSDCVATISGTNINVTVPYGTDVTALVATFSTTGQSVSAGGSAQMSGETATNFTNPVTYTVTAADGSTKDYTVTVTVALSPAKEITGFKFTSALNLGRGLHFDCVATISGNTITLKMPANCAATNLIATFTTTGQTVAVGVTSQTSGSTANDFLGTVTYTVTAADGSTQDYYVTATPSTRTLAASSFTVGSTPYRVAVNPGANIVYVTNRGSNTVTYLNATTGAVLGTYTAGSGPWGIAVNPTANILYVANYYGGTVTYFNAITGAYINGALAASSFTTGSSHPIGLAVDAGRNILYVTNSDGSDSVTLLNATTGDNLGSFGNVYEPVGIAIDTVTNVLYVTNCGNNTVSFIDASDGSSMGAYSAGSYPSGVAVNHSANTVYVTNLLGGTMNFYNATTGANLGSYDAGYRPGDIAVNVGANILYVANLTVATVKYFNATTGGNLGTYSTGTGPCGVAVNESANILYVVNQTSNTVTFFDATTGDYLY